MTSVSEVIEGLPGRLKEGKISVHDVMEEMNGRSLLLVILLLIIPNLIPFINSLGITHITGILLLIFTIRLMVGIHHPWLPEWLGNMKTDKKHIQKISEKAAPWFKRMERIVRPRIYKMAGEKIHFFYAFLLLILTIIMLLPLPFINVIPAIIMMIITLGLIQQDGLVSALGAILAIALLTGLIYAVTLVGSSIFTEKDIFFDYETYPVVHF
ncbi:MAG: hypothetical protein CO093_10750 [Alphaproteobacteria bacterium CG_4_9_14_3_um_filter_47_13]|nr:MAG: hypothetical protein CO093_10750 [Alphaproteobacteria bacterium CG_4_9_14_3_um_filter_47_13]